MKSAAIEYLKHGLNVIPIGKTKKSLVEWKPYQTERVDETLIHTWWQKWPDANIGIVTGAISGIMVVDVDTDEGLDALNEFLNDTFATPAYRTPSGGKHFWFKYKPGLVNRARTITGCDIRTDGGYVVVPPSANGAGGKYAWLEGMGFEFGVSEMPDFLFDTLSQLSATGGQSKIDYIPLVYDQITQRQLSSTQSTSVNRISLKSGTRDQDLFHVANCLVKGGMNPHNILIVLSYLAKCCDPPFSDNEVEVKVRSALQRGENKSRNLTQEIREWVLSTSGNFSSTQCQLDQLLSTRNERALLSKVLRQMVDEGEIERVGNKNGWFRKIEVAQEEMCFIEHDIVEFPVKLPFGMNDLCTLYPKNIVVIAGTKSAGKTAFLLDIAMRNRGVCDVVYLNSEMGDEEWTMRLKNRGVKSKDDIRFKAYNCHNNFHDHMDGSRKIYIVDYLEIHEQFWEIAKPIRLIHEKLKDGICFISVQKKRSHDLGRGAEFSMEKSRLYLTMDYLQDQRCTKLTIVDAKAPKLGVSIAGFFKRIKIYDGAKMEAISKEWER